MELAVVGLNGAGKSSFVSVLQGGTASFDENTLPTIGFNMRRVTSKKISLKLWDLGGQRQFRGMWERYCRDVDVIVFVVDASDEKALDVAHDELRRLLSHVVLDRIPLLVLLNKNDLPDALSPDRVVDALELSSIKDREVAYYSISCKSANNIDKTLKWLTEHAKNKDSK